MFAVFAELQFESPHALQLLCIEPLTANFTLLQANLKKYVPSAYAVQVALVPFARDDGKPITSDYSGSKNDHSVIARDDHTDYHYKVCGDASDEGAAKEQHNVRKSKEINDSVAMTYFPRMPGNSCYSEVADEKRRQFSGKPSSPVEVLAGREMDRSAEESAATADSLLLLQSCCEEGADTDFTHRKRCDFVDGAVEEYCLAKTLSQVLDEYSGSRLLPPRIALLKVDVEGAELSVLQGLSDAHWSLIDQIVVESSTIPLDSTTAHTSSVKRHNNVSANDIAGASLADAIVKLLEMRGFSVKVVSDLPSCENTPNVMIYATRLRNDYRFTFT